MRSRKFFVRTGAVLVAAAATATAVVVTVQEQEAAVAPASATAGADLSGPAGALLQERVNKVRTDHKLPGMIGMVRSGDSYRYASTGWNDQFRRIPADPKSQFRIFSNTKAFTATVLLQLEAEGKLSMNDTVDRWLPGLVNAGGNDGKQITIRQLLNHSSGLPDYINDIPTSLEYVADLNPYRKLDPRHLVKIAMSKGQIGPPGAQYFYSNANYHLAGLIIQAATGRHPSAEVTDRIIKPLGLSNTTYPESDPKLYGNWMHGYFLSLRDISFSNVTYLGPGGAIVSTQDDLANFTRALATGKLLPPAQQKQMMTPFSAEKAAGLGVMLKPTRCGPALWHNGAGLGYFSQWFTSPDGKHQSVVATNSYNFVPELSKGTTEATFKAAEDGFCALKGQ
ncbi:class A beta-lactamase-related serine hydrolase [Actinomadura sp. KC345]|uniref:serine hydrolase domain-containing protein n=1 Tax=Actinomadura sp. KC345 TaxID=2530371 RepID=UPI001049F41A|nr:serine hydrolase domain-containing protein [Actinomadura sp. KC345]TDC46676.1 class A beta-lactamase-related serine hydrolase [Actinomadura sp. KC345]